ncbi:hypothetical protein F909_02880 [Acinetobacter sp. ANC 3929]|uniref:hypothetical protein n=1 Tax=Acinetobacter sp. ANC 3929 TaxID=1217707 RepID=UPI0002CE8A3A|nr:hypothetical protein [Acinetobacter sp. ANC 3929]ENW79777.1 hypothetical protein F909_02880 [Acinetobacter sp. ANC 3929]
MEICIVDTLPVALTVMVKGKPISSKKIEFADINSSDLLKARSKAVAGDFLQILEYCAKIKLIDEKGNKHDVPYDVLAFTTSANLKKLEELDFDLLVKLQAESSETPSS